MAEYEIHAVRYAHMPTRRASDIFIGSDDHDGPMPLDFFVWALKGDDGRIIIVDTGFDEAMAKKRNRMIVRPVAEGLKGVGIDPAKVENVIITHMHY